MPSPVAIVDIGSNSIKLLVAAAGAGGLPETVASRTLDTRISAGISQASPRLGEAGMAAGVAAIRELVTEAARFGAHRTVLVATSAVRDAANGAEFRDRVRRATGHTLRILSGGEEANLIGRGLTCDPALAGLRDFYVFDLGGGSLECLVFRDRRAVQETSLPLGCVRLTEQCVPDPAQPFGTAEAQAVGRAVEAAFARANFSFSLADGAAVVGTGGTLTTARAVLAAHIGRTLEASDPILTTTALGELRAGLGALPLAERKRIPGLPPARADVFPTALATLLAVAQLGRFSAYRHSFYNLRWGLAAEELAKG
jgi:exopolyphosphatase / guanosine-5'-triphosphate,3'-diphosphate pyrophosphatase